MATYNGFDQASKNEFHLKGLMSQTKPSLDDLRIERKSTPEPALRVWLWGMVVLVLLLLGTASLWWVKAASAIEVHTVVVREASSGDAERTVLNASGYVTARREATVSSK